MKYVEEPSRKIPIVAEVDVVVVGGGVAGIAAAIAAARLRANVILIERYGFLGGMATAGLVITVPPMKKGLQVEFAKRLEELNAYVLLRKPLGVSPQDISRVFDPEVFKIVIVGMLKEAGIRILLHTLVVGVISRNNAVKGVIIENKEGRQVILAKTVIDASGDADLSYFANAPYIKETDFPVTLMFNMVGVDVDRVLSFLGDFGRLREIVREAANEGELSLLLETEPSLGAPGLYLQTTVHPDELNVWGGNLFGVDGTKAEDLTHAEIVVREQAKILADFLKKKVPGFEKSRIEHTAAHVGIRETRRIIGEYTLTLDDMKGDKEVRDVVAKPFAGSRIAVPYRCLLPKKIDNLLAVGRCISATPEALVTLRLIPACIATGQAGGTAAALSVRKKTPPKQLDVKILQRALRDQGLI